MKLITSLFLGASIALASCNSDAPAKAEAKTAHAKTEAKTQAHNEVKVNESKKQSNVVAKNIQLADFDQVMADKKPILIDVRTAQEFASGHIEGAINIDVMTPSFKSEMAKLNAKDKALMLYCRSGNRSGRAMKVLKNEGYTEMYNLMGGYMAYSKK